MKKIFSIIALGTLVLAGCVKFQDEKIPDFAPATEPVISEVSFDDYSLSATITAAEGTGYYSWAVIAGASKVNPDALLSNSLKAIVKGSVKASDKPSVSFTVEDLDPNTTYTVYAVAANAQGVVSEVATATKTTSDSTVPTLSGVDSEVEGSEMVIWLGYDEEVTPTGAGTVTAYLFGVNSTPGKDGYLSPLASFDVPVETLIEDGEWVGIPIPEEAYQPGAYVFVTISEGIVKNAVGLENAAYKNALCTPEGPERGICEQFENVSWGLALGEYTAAGFQAFPADTTVYFSDFQELMMLVALDSAAVADNIILADGSVEAEITYTQSNGRKVSYPSSGFSYYPNGGFFYGYLDEAPEFGATVSVSVSEACLKDIWGNANSALEVEDVYFCSYGYTISDFVGTWEFDAYTSKGVAQPTQQVIIEPVENVKDSVWVKGIFDGLTCLNNMDSFTNLNTAFKACIDLDMGALVLDLGVIGYGSLANYGWEDYVYACCIAGNYFTDITFQMPAKGSFVLQSEISFYLNNLGIWAKIPAGYAELTKVSNDIPSAVPASCPTRILLPKTESIKNIDLN